MQREGCGVSGRKRVGISKKTRFEVFKRDQFACQYCGAHPPAAILHVDHIHPIAEGGSNHQDNLVTACADCNGGKGARLLTAVPDSITTRAADVAEREEQLRGYQQLLRERADRIEQEAWEIAEIIEPGASDPDGKGFSRRGLISIRRFIDRLGFFLVKDAAELAYQRIRYSENQRFRYFCGVCWGRIRDQDDARPKP